MLHRKLTNATDGSAIKVEYARTAGFTYVFGTTVYVEYATMSPFSLNNRWLILQHPDGRVGLYTGDGVFVALLPPAITHHSEPRWSRKDANLLYFVAANRLMGCVIGTDPEAHNIYMEHWFSEYIEHDAEGRLGVCGLGESDICEDGDKFVLRGIRSVGESFAEDVFVYSLTTGKGHAFLAPPMLRSLYITPYYVLCGTLSGTYLFSHTGAGRVHPVVEGQAPHMAVHGDNLIYCSSNDARLNKNAVVIVDLANFNDRRVLLELDWGYGFHISACASDFCLVSAYDMTNRLPPQLWRVPYSGTPELLLEFESTMRDYTSQPKASLSRDGSLAAYNIDNGSTIDVGLIHLGNKEAQVPVLEPLPAQPTLTEVNLTALEGKRWRFITDLQVVNGQFVSKVTMYDVT